ncbi:hypothetical protein [uncultured Mediterranean phage uvMED]|nr:hypothetical protein [uncultured Mediterranean phage uvMED]BAR19716.1 hypothetical protein [uncultured Mediterranean phage uvMED]BAR19789.1 hypothetical protein [uncultured Mediterranean phage uvMED]
MDYKKRAIRARNLLGNEEFQGIMKDLREDQLRLIANTSASEVEKREDAHAIYRALNEIEFLLSADVDAEKLIERKARDAHEQH